MLEAARHEQSLILLLSLTDRDNFNHSKFTDREKEINRNLNLEKLHRQKKCYCIIDRRTISVH